MSRRANCWDNAGAESFISSSKTSGSKKRTYARRGVAISDIADYIDGLYHPMCRRTHLGGVSPDEFEATHRHRRAGVH